MKVAKVSYGDSDGVEHAVTVEADSLYHAIGLAILRFRSSNVEPGFSAFFVVQPREALPEHKVSRQQFDAWLAKEGVSSPAETFSGTRCGNCSLEPKPKLHSAKLQNCAF